ATTATAAPATGLPPASRTRPVTVICPAGGWRAAPDFGLAALGGGALGLGSACCPEVASGLPASARCAHRPAPTVRSPKAQTKAAGLCNLLKDLCCPSFPTRRAAGGGAPGAPRRSGQAGQCGSGRGLNQQGRHNGRVRFLGEPGKHQDSSRGQAPLAEPLLED